MGKRVYRVKKGDDFIKISRKLYGNASYVMDLMRANPGFYRLGKGMVLRLPKEDPRLTRKRKIKRRMKDYVPPPEETGDTTNQAIPSEGETGNGEESGAELSQSGESLGWDPAFEDEIINSIAETAKKMGLDADVMADELGISEGHLPSKEESSKDWTQSRTEKGNLHSPRTSPSRKPQSQTGDGSQIPMEVPSPLPTLTDEQIDALKEELEKLGLDVDVAMEELGLGEGAAASTTATQTTGEGANTSPGNGKDDGKGGPGGKVARPAEPDVPTQTETPPPPAYQDIQTREEADVWFNDRFYKAKEKGDRAMMRQLELARYAKLYELWLREQKVVEDSATPTPTPQPTLTAEEQKRADIKAEYETINMPEEGPYIPDNHILDYSGFGEGYSEWSEGEIVGKQLKYYILRGEKGDPIEERLPDAAQYMSPYLITNNKKLMNSIHNNLCGELAVIAALGLDLAEGLNLFAEIKIDGGDKALYGLDNGPDTGADILNDGSIGTTYLTLINFINHTSGSKYTGTKRSSNNNHEEFGSVDYLKESLQNGNKIIALVNIDKNNEGSLNAKDDTSNPTSHWIEVQDVITTKEGETYVRVYNPYMNREEIYDEKTFMAAWEKTGDTKEKNNINQHLIIEISETGE